MKRVIRTLSLAFLIVFFFGFSILSHADVSELSDPDDILPSDESEEEETIDEQTEERQDGDSSFSELGIESDSDVQDEEQNDSDDEENESQDNSSEQSMEEQQEERGRQEDPYQKENQSVKDALQNNAKSDTLTNSAPAMNDSTPEPLRIVKEGTEFYLRGGTDEDYKDENWIQTVGEKKYIIDAENRKVLTGIQQIEGTDYYAYASTEDEAGYLAEDADALYPVGGEYYYIKNGQVNTYTGIVHKSDEGGWFSVKNGVYVTDFTGLAMREDNGKYYYVENGKYTKGFHGIARKIDEKSGWYYAKDSKYRPTFTGLANKPGTDSYYFVKDGKYDKSFTGLAKSAHAKGYYYAENGKYKKTYTGLAGKIDAKGWHFVKNGKYNTSFKGLAKKPGTKNYYYVEKGKYTKGFTGLAKSAHAKGYFYAEDSKYKKTYTGLTKKIDAKGWHFAKNGKYDTKFKGLARKPGTKDYYYVEKGRYTKGFTGLAKSAHADGYYYAKKSKYNKTYTGPSFSAHAKGIYHVKNGKWANTVSRFVSNKNGAYDVKNGKVYGSQVKINGKNYYVDAKGRVATTEYVPFTSGMNLDSNIVLRYAQSLGLDVKAFLKASKVWFNDGTVDKFWRSQLGRSILEDSIKFRAGAMCGPIFQSYHTVWGNISGNTCGSSASWEDYVDYLHYGSREGFQCAGLVNSFFGYIYKNYYHIPEWKEYYDAWNEGIQNLRGFYARDGHYNMNCVATVSSGQAGVAYANNRDSKLTYTRIKITSDMTDDDIIAIFDRLLPGATIIYSKGDTSLNHSAVYIGKANGLHWSFHTTINSHNLPARFSPLEYYTGTFSTSDGPQRLNYVAGIVRPE